MTDKGSYRSVYSAIWDDPEFQSFDMTTQMVFLCLRTSSDCNFPCIFTHYHSTLYERLPNANRKAIDKGIDTLAKAGWIRYERPVLWIVKGLQNEPTYTSSNPKHISGIVNTLKSLPKLKIVEEFATYYGIPCPFDTPIHTLAIPLRYPSDTCMDSLPNQGEGEGEGIKHSPVSGETGVSSGSVKASKAKASPYTPEFQEFWDAYPRRVEKEDAFGAWNGAIKKFPPEDLIAAAREYAEECNRLKTEVNFIKYPATFLRKGRWKDWCFEEPPEPETPTREPPEPLPELAEACGA